MKDEFSVFLVFPVARTPLKLPRSVLSIYRSSFLNRDDTHKRLLREQVLSVGSGYDSRRTACADDVCFLLQS